MARRDIPLEKRIIFALDVPTGAAARDWVRRLEPRVRFFKVGLQLFLAAGFGVVDWILARGHEVMLDLKFFDVPETVRLAVAQLAGRGVSFATVHGNDAILRAAVAAKGDVRLLAVTVLTSFDESDLRAMGMTGSVEDLVLRRARRAQELGCDGIVASGREAARVRAELGDGLLVVTPGIRPAGPGPGDDQRRKATAGEAVAAGADHVVVGRPVRDAADPLVAVTALQDEIAAALAAPAGA
ncbi:orotidine-5'-phosphate decarboxylase [Dissulfurirhabdus thermomarina]|uniref:Orotidine 5'-phosphate decarboxylase n=1 Tax=Dissulfurirhabdus thermomarina TaxID=1765737 RepID=A0A6N9TX19_DISTH|nr:orotidine-5'-phosphate decarboxylase [Dissulfurirhabdus thermomarina]NDY43026.1 orotidine-5'-phosphate decarboxylase [Dissulfurirhabdus thermomarina]NMX22915.1 orotidine-5'-phosphate decarboxylase [Dissulfurirhabdus thermomarina]